MHLLLRQIFRHMLTNLINVCFINLCTSDKKYYRNIRYKGNPRAYKIEKEETISAGKSKVVVDENEQNSISYNYCLVCCSIDFVSV